MIGSSPPAPSAGFLLPERRFEIGVHYTDV